MKKAFELFSGKDKLHNEKILTVLYNNGPLSSWEITNRYPRVKIKGNPHALNATLNKRLRVLEAKQYVEKDGSKFILRFKGLIAVLLTSKEPKIWNAQWTKYFEPKAIADEQKIKPYLEKLGVGNQESIVNILRTLRLNPDGFNDVVGYSKRIRDLLERGVINFDVIDGRDLFLISVIFVLLPVFSLEEIGS